MPEYLIKATTGPANRPAVPKGRLLHVLEPRGYGSVRVDGPGDLRLVLGGCEMIFSGEEAGWRVWFEGDTAGQTLTLSFPRSLSRFKNSQANTPSGSARVVDKGRQLDAIKPALGVHEQVVGHPNILLMS